MGRMIRRSACGVFLALALSTSGAFAQDVAAAEALFREGRALMKSGDFAKACAKLAESQRLDPSSGTLLNLATCHAKQGKTATAWAEYLAAARLSKSQGRPQRAKEAKARAAELEPDLSYLTIAVSQKLPDMRVLRGDVELEASVIGSKIPTDPGEHEITVSAPGYKSVSLKVNVGAKGDAQTLAIPALDKEDPEAPVGATPTPQEPPTASTQSAPTRAPPTTDQPVSESDNTLAYVVGGVGVAAAAVGGVFGVMALSSYSDAEDQCPTRKGCSQAAVDKRDTASTQANIANIGIGVGIVGIGVGAVLLLTSGPSEPAAEAATRITPLVGRDSAGLGLSGAF